jgi:hypothetical protein
MGEDAAVAVAPYASLGLLLPQTLRGFCGVPAVTLADPPNARLGDVARHWERAGRRLFVASAVPELAMELAPGAAFVAHIEVADTYQPERTFTDRPRRYKPAPLEFWLYEVRPR